MLYATGKAYQLRLFATKTEVEEAKEAVANVLEPTSKTSAL